MRVSVSVFVKPGIDLRVPTRGRDQATVVDSQEHEASGCFRFGGIERAHT